MRSTFLYIGGGNMAKAMISGAIRAGIHASSDVTVAELDETKHHTLRAMGVHVFSDARRAVENDAGSTIIFAVKPQSFSELAVALAPALSRSPRLVLSVMAGIRSATILPHLHEDSRLIRIMPNLPSQIGAGATAVAPSRGATQEDLAFADALARALGPVVVRMQEDMIDAFTALAGSGPAYVFYLAEAMMNAAHKLGFTPADARRIVAQTIFGAAAMMQPNEVDPAALRAAVTSKGGTTQAATDHMDKGDVMNVIAQAILAAERRGRELGGREHGA